MKNCDDIRTELSPYVDGELTSSQRAKVDAHLASCPDCRHEVTELKTLAAGLAALPQLRPAPGFLAEVRRKIAHGDNPAPPTWQDYLFRPVWLKVPLELAAIIAIVGYVMRSQEPMSVQRGTSIEMAKTENSPSEREALETAVKPEAADRSESVAAPTALTPRASVDAGQESPAAEPMQSLKAQIATDSQIVPSKDKKTLDLATDSLKLENRRLPVAFGGSSGGFAMAAEPSAIPDGVALAANFGIDPSKLGGVMMVNNKTLSDVRGRAELLAAKCNGRVFPVPQSKDVTGQVFFVEVPREYAAAFRLELLQEAPPPRRTNYANVHAESVSATETVATSAIAGHAEGGVLVGSPETNESFNTYSRLDLVRDAKTPEPPTVVLEIVVVPPAK